MTSSRRARTYSRTRQRLQWIDQHIGDSSALAVSTQATTNDLLDPISSIEQKGLVIKRIMGSFMVSAEGTGNVNTFHAGFCLVNGDAVTAGAFPDLISGSGAQEVRWFWKQVFISWVWTGNRHPRIVEFDVRPNQKLQSGSEELTFIYYNNGAGTGTLYGGVRVLVARP